MQPRRASSRPCAWTPVSPPAPREGYDGRLGNTRQRVLEAGLKRGTGTASERRRRDSDGTMRRSGASRLLFFLPSSDCCGLGVGNIRQVQIVCRACRGSGRASASNQGPAHRWQRSASGSTPCRCRSGAKPARTCSVDIQAASAQVQATATAPVRLASVQDHCRAPRHPPRPPIGPAGL